MQSQFSSRRIKVAEASAMRNSAPRIARPQTGDRNQRSGTHMSVMVSVQNQSQGGNRPVSSHGSGDHYQNLADRTGDFSAIEQDTRQKEQLCEQATDQQTLNLSAGIINVSRDKAVSISHSTEKIQYSPELMISYEKINQNTLLSSQDNTMLVPLNVKKSIIENDDKLQSSGQEIAAKEFKSPINIVAENHQYEMRPFTSFQNARNINDTTAYQTEIRIRKKRISSTKPGGIRGSQLVQDRFSLQNTSTPNKRRLTSKKVLNKYTKPDSEHGLCSSKMYNSYAPTGLIKVGTRSVQRLQPRAIFRGSSIKSGSSFEGRPTTANVGQSASSITKISNGRLSDAIQSSYDMSSVAARPILHAPLNTHIKRKNKLSSMKAAMTNSSQVYGTTKSKTISKANKIEGYNQVSQKSSIKNFGMRMGSGSAVVYENDPDDYEPLTAQTFGEADSAYAGAVAMDQDSFKLVPQFDTEEDAMKYAAELQKYYDSRNLDVNVQIEMNLQDMDDTPGQNLITEEKSEEQMEKQEKQIEKSLVHSDIRRQMKKHFHNTEKTNKKKGQLIKRSDDLTDLKFEKRVNTQKGRPSIEYNYLSKADIDELRCSQDQIYAVIQQTARFPGDIPYQNQEAKHRNFKNPGFKLDKETQKIQIKQQANTQAQILRRIGVLPADLCGAVQQASSLLTTGEGVAKSRAKFFQREKRMKRRFDDQVAQWHEEEKTMPKEQTPKQSDIEQFKTAGFKVDVQLYKERGDDYRLMGNKMQYRACEQNIDGRNYCNKQAMATKGNFDPIRIKLRIMPVSKAPLAQGKTPDYYFIVAAKKALSGNLTGAIEQLKRGLLINPNHFICRFNHGVLMFKMGLIREAEKDFEQLTTHPWGVKDAWVHYNLALCKIQMNHPESQTNQEKLNHSNTMQSTVQFSLETKSNLSCPSQTILKQKTVINGHKVYIDAVELCEKAHKLGGSDHEIQIDALNLQGVCLFRLGKLRDAVLSLKNAKTIRQRIDAKAKLRRARMRKKDMLNELEGPYFTKRDMIAIRKKRSQSFDFKRHKKLRQMRPTQHERRRKHSWAARDTFEKENRQMTQTELSNDNVISDSSSNSESEVEPTKSAEDSHSSLVLKQISETMKIVESEKSDMDQITIERIKRQSSEISRRMSTLNCLGTEDLRNESSQRSSKLVSPPHSTQTQKEIMQKKIEIILEKKAVKKAEQKAAEKKAAEMKAAEKKATEEKQKVQPSPITVQEKRKKLRFMLPDGPAAQEQQRKKAIFAKALLSRISKMSIKYRPDYVSTTKLQSFEDLMNKLESQNKVQSYERKRMDLGKTQYALFRKFYLQMRKSSDEVIDADNPLLRLKNIYSQQFEPDETEYADCNAYEVIELKKRASIFKWVESDLIRQLMIESLKRIATGEEEEAATLSNTRFVEQLLTQAQVKFEEIAGTHLEQLVDIIEDQAKMDGTIAELNNKVDDMCYQFEKKLKRGMDELYSNIPKLDEIKILRGEQHETEEDEQQLGMEDKMIIALRDALHNEDTCTPDEVINILTTAIFEKEKMKLQQAYLTGISDEEDADDDKFFFKRKQIELKDDKKTKVKQDMRYTERHIMIVRNQLRFPPIDRNYKILDIMMRHLRFLKRHEKSIRQEIYKVAQLIDVPTQTVLFDIGDSPDFMYIILKGRVVISNTHFLYKDVNRVLTTLKDGDEFGSINVVEQQHLRQTMAKTVELTRMLRLTVTEANAIIRPIGHETAMISPLNVSQHLDKPSKKDQSQVKSGTKSLAISRLQSIGTASNVSFPSEIKDRETDELQQRITFLHSCEIFQHIKKSKMLMPVAVNLTPVKFKYGEFLSREGQVPPGMYVIKSGQCIVGLSRTAERPKIYTDIPGMRKPIVDKYPLFNNFDPDNTLLAGVEIPDRIFQNQRIYIENNQQVRDKIIYKDFLHYSTLFPKKQFGGRCLLPFELYMSLRRIYFGDESLRMPDSTINEADKDDDEILSNKQLTVETKPCPQKKREHYQMKSMLDVVADSAVVEAYLITKTAINYLNDNYLKNAYEFIVQEKEPDRPMREDKILQKREQMLADQEVQKSTVQQIRYANKIEKFGVMQVK